MVICICNHVAERAIKAAVRAGATSVADVVMATGACTQCRQCETCIEQMLTDRALPSPCSETTQELEVGN